MNHYLLQNDGYLRQQELIRQAEQRRFENRLARENQSFPQSATRPVTLVRRAAHVIALLLH